MKKFLSSALAVMMLASLAACGPTAPTPAPAETPSEAPADPAATPSETPSEAPVEATATDITIGSCIYKFDDTFMTGVRNNMSTQAEELGVTLELVDSQNEQPTQNEQVDTYITKGVSALAINTVDRTASGPIMEKAQAEGLPIVFFNREPLAEVMSAYDKVWYVGAHAEESGTMSGQIISDYFTANPTADKNGDGTIQYVMLTGEPGHQDATLRTEYSTKAMQDAGFQIEQLGSDTAMWDKVRATDLMKTFIASHGLDKIEAVLANNDDMALGAIEALKAEGYNSGDATKFIPVAGVDGSAPALAAMDDGSLLGTVLNDAEGQGRAVVQIATASAQGKAVDDTTIDYPITDGKYVWIPYVKITAENYEQFK